MPTTVANEQITRIVHEHEIRRTLYQWVHALDLNRYEEFRDTYAPQGTMQVFRNDYVVETEEQFRKFFDMNISQGAHLHFNTSPLIIELTDDTAKVESYAVRIDAFGETKEPLTRAIAVYRDDFARSADGRWRIAFRFVDRLAFNLAGIDPSHPAAIQAR